MTEPRTGILAHRYLRAVMRAPNKDGLAWSWTLQEDALWLVLGNGEWVTMPLKWLPSEVANRVREGVDPRIVDYGQTVRFGRYEVSVHAILAEFPHRSKSCTI